MFYFKHVLSRLFVNPTMELEHLRPNFQSSEDSVSGTDNFVGLLPAIGVLGSSAWDQMFGWPKLGNPVLPVLYLVATLYKINQG